jgi:hypothetical protein
MVVLDALNGDAPQVIAILGTRTATLDMAAFARGREYVVRAVRRRWPKAEYAYEVEFTTGYGPRSGGLRRPHWNWFWKGIPRSEVEEARDVISRTWCAHVDALPEAQYVEEIDNAVGLSKYVTEHFMKASQRPPAGFTGQRFCASRGYFGEGVSVQTARKRARESLRSKRELWKALQAGFDAHDAELVAHQALELAAETVWVLATKTGARLSPTQYDPRRMVLCPTAESGSRSLSSAKMRPSSSEPDGAPTRCSGMPQMGDTGTSSNASPTAKPTPSARPGVSGCSRGRRSDLILKRPHEPPNRV